MNLIKRVYLATRTPSGMLARETTPSFHFLSSGPNTALVSFCLVIIQSRLPVGTILKRLIFYNFDARQIFQNFPLQSKLNKIFMNC